MFPARYLFVTSMGIRQLACLLCAIARNSPTFIIGRFLDGVAKSGIMSGALVYVMRISSRPSTRASFWIPALMLTGTGNGIGFEQSQISVQTVLSEEYISLGIGFVLFAQTLGPAIFLSIANNVLPESLKKALSQQLPGSSASNLLLEGAISFRRTFQGAQPRIIIILYASAPARCF